MKFALTMFWLSAGITAAAAQYGVSNIRDGYGNLVRDTGMNSQRNNDQTPVNNLGGSNRRIPQPQSQPISNSGTKGAVR
jgi:hypothetical protein